ncbi:MAG: hypothetical protein R6V86_09145 [Spirochaetia bacterium]
MSAAAAGEPAFLGLTEPFFDLLPRFPHFIKMLFHALQWPFPAVLGYTPLAPRLLSLSAACLALLFFHRTVGALARGSEPAPSFGRSLSSGRLSISFGTVSLLALDIQFIYAAHFGRQEILLMAALTAALWLYLRSEQTAVDGQFGMGHRGAAMVIGLSIGIHPNAFLISLPIGAFLLVDLVIALVRAAAAGGPCSRVGQVLRHGLEYAGILAAWAGLYVGLSYLLDPQFLSHYAAFGDRVGVAEPLYIKAFRFPDFYQKLYYRISGTYYTPAIQLQFFLFGAALVAAPITALLYRGPSALLRRRLIQLPAALLLLNIGTLVLGKYSQPSIVLHFPLYYLLIATLLLAWTGRTGRPLLFRSLVLWALLAATAANSGYNIAQELHLLSPKPREYYETYTQYGHKLHSFVPPDATVLANLNAEYHFDHGRLYDYRNLAYLDEARLSFDEYIEKNNIEYIVYPEEMDLIYNRRPMWNILYGNVAGYYDEMQQFLGRQCTEVGHFESPIYGMRITRYMGRRPWKVTVYRVNN